ncbi:MAG: hypothetical protein ACOC22_00425 [bacterium]
MKEILRWLFGSKKNVVVNSSHLREGKLITNVKPPATTPKPKINPAPQKIIK